MPASLSYVGGVVQSPAGNYTVKPEDAVILADTTAARAITLCAATRYPPGRMLIVKDRTGTAAANNITTTCAGADTFESGTTSQVVNTNFGDLMLESDGVSKWYIMALAGGGGGGGGGGVTSVSSGGTGITISPTTGVVVVTPNAFTAVAPGQVPLSGGGTSNFLRADATWAAPPGAVASVTAGAGLTGGGTGAVTVDVANADGSLTIGVNDVAVSATVQAGAALGSTSVQPARQVVAGAGLTGGGTLAADRTIDVANADGSLTVGANDVAVSAAIQAGAAAGATAVQPARQVIAGAGLTGGGSLAADRTLDVVAANSTITVNTDSLQVGVISDANVDDTIVTTDDLTEPEDILAQLVEFMEVEVAILKSIDINIASYANTLPADLGDE